MFRFSIRDVLWLTVVVGLGTAWIVQGRELANIKAKAAVDVARIRNLIVFLKENGYSVPGMGQYAQDQAGEKSN